MLGSFEEATRILGGQSNRSLMMRELWAPREEPDIGAGEKRPANVVRLAGREAQWHGKNGGNSGSAQQRSPQ